MTSIVGLASHSVVGAVVGGVVGGVAGNAIARDGDCAKEEHRAEADADRRADADAAYQQGYQDRAADDRAAADDRPAVDAPRPLQSDADTVPDRDYPH